MKDQKNTQYDTKYVQMLWVEMLNNSKNVRKIVFKIVYKGESKEDIKFIVNEWNNLTDEDKSSWVNEYVLVGDNSNLFIDLVFTLKQYKNPKKAYEIWKINNKLK